MVIYNLDWKTTEELFDIFISEKSIKVFHKNKFVIEFHKQNRMFNKIVDKNNRDLLREIKSTINHIAGHYSVYNEETNQILGY